MNIVKVLITGIGAPGAPGIVRCLRANRERDLYLIGCDRNPMAGGRSLVEEFHVIPDADDSDFIDELIRLSIECGVDVVLPLVTRELEVISQNLELFRKSSIAVSVMESSKLQMANDKAKLLTTLKQDGFHTPKFIIVNDTDALEAAANELGYPKRAICVKGAKGNGSRGVRILDPGISQYDLFFNEKPSSMYSTLEYVLNALKEKKTIPTMMVMEYLPGEEYGVDALCDNGKVLFISGRHNTTVSSSIPQGCVIEEREEPIEFTKRVIKRYKLDGNLNFDFRYDKDGVPQLMEINPRLSATIVAYAPAGINFPYLRVKQLLGEALPVLKAQEGIVMQRRYRETFFNIEGDEIDW